MMSFFMNPSIQNEFQLFFEEFHFNSMLLFVKINK